MTTLDKAWFEAEMAGHGLSLRALATQMDMDASALSRSLNAKRKFKFPEIEKMAKALARPVPMVLEKLGLAMGETTEGFGEMQQPDFQQQAKRHPLFGLLKGTSIVAPGVDLTAPADPEWAKVYDDDHDHGVIVEPVQGKGR